MRRLVGTWARTLGLGVLLGVAACGDSTAPPAVGSVSVVPNSIGPIAPGATATASADVRDASGQALTGRTVTWSSSSPSVATVSSSGVITGVAEGSATVTASVEGKSGSAAVAVRVPPALVLLTPASTGLLVGATQTLTLTVKDANGATLTGRTATWSSSNPAIASVNAAGQVTGVAMGQVIITATVDGQSGTALVTVTPTATVTIAPSPFTVFQGGTRTLTATPRDAAGNPVTGRTVVWTSATPSIATVNAIGVVTGVASGTATIVATIDGVQGTATGTVITAPVNTVTLSPAVASFVQGSTQPLIATLRDADGTALTGRTITWSSSNTAVATVNGSGVVTGVAAGTVTITATSEGKSGTAALTVRAIDLEPALVVTSTTAGDTTQRVIVLAGQTTTAQPALIVRNNTGGTLAASSVRWTVRDSSRATVSATGVITGLRPGRTFVVAQSATNSAIGDSVLVYIPANSTGALLRTASPSYRIVATDTFSIVVQVEMRDGKALSAADFEISWPGAAAYPYNPFTVTSVTSLRAGVVLSVNGDYTETARVTWASTTPVSGTVALVRLNCKVAQRGVPNQIVLTLNQLVASDFSNITAAANTFNPIVIVP